MKSTRYHVAKWPEIWEDGYPLTRRVWEKRMRRVALREIALVLADWESSAATRDDPQKDGT